MKDYRYVKYDATMHDKVVELLQPKINDTEPMHDKDLIAFVNTDGRIKYARKGTMLYDMYIDFGTEVSLCDFAYDIDDAVCVENTHPMSCGIVIDRYSPNGNPTYLVRNQHTGMEMMYPESHLKRYQYPNYELKPFDRVLVRDHDHMKWTGDIYIDYIENSPYRYQCIGGSYNHCIPYEGHEDLLGTLYIPEY